MDHAMSQEHDHSHAKHHDYHLVNPSPWPLLSSVSAFFMAVGLVFWMKGMSVLGHQAGAYVFGTGFIALLFVLGAWWLDVTREALGGDHTRVVQLSHRYGMMMFIASVVMFFVGWFWAFFDVALFADNAQQFQRAAVTGGVWPPKGIETFDPWHLPLLNTLILLTSGATITWAHHSLLENDKAGFKLGLTLTIVLGIAFSFCQAFEYSHAGFGFSGSIYGATFFMATGFHGVHVIIGTIFLIVCLLRAHLGQFSPERHLGFEFAAWYWHFVDVVWLFLFASIYIYGSGGAAGH